MKREKREGSIGLALLLGLGPLALGALLAYKVWSLTGQLVGGSLIHYLWRLPLCAYAFGAPVGLLAQFIFGQREDLLDSDPAEVDSRPSNPGEQ